MIKGEEPDPYKEVEIFPYISSQLPQVSTVYCAEENKAPTKSG